MSPVVSPLPRAGESDSPGFGERGEGEGVGVGGGESVQPKECKQCTAFITN
jgi:hypothetical protein